MIDPPSPAHLLLDDIAQVLISAERINARVAELGAQISADYAGQGPLLVGVLRGVFVFMADLVRTITLPISIDFVGISRYGPPLRAQGQPIRAQSQPLGVQSSSSRTLGAVRLTKDLETDIAGRHVLFVEDVVSTGMSLRYILRTLRTREPASLRVCTLFDKPNLRLVNLDIAYTGFVLPDKFVVGYGLDYDDRYRNLPFVGELKDSAITERRLP